MLDECPTRSDDTAREIGSAPFAIDASFASPQDTRFGLVLDQIDYGLLLVGTDLALGYANRAARAMLAEDHPMRIAGGTLTARAPADAAQLRGALLSARRGLRALLILGTGDQRVCVAVVPLKSADVLAHETLVVVGKRAVCEALSAQWYARSHGLTAAETQVLNLLCAGTLPREIARRQGVAISTIRTQISSIRAKTGTSTVASLLRDVAVLPPLVHALQGTPSAQASVH